MLTAAALALVLSQNPEAVVAPPLVDSTGVVHSAAPEYRRLHELVAVGGASAAAGWVVGIVGWFASISCRDTGAHTWGIDIKCWSTSPWIMFPQLGPWLALATRGTYGDWVAPTVALGVVQLVGLATLIAGASIRIPTGNGGAVVLEPTPMGVSGRF